MKHFDLIIIGGGAGAFAAAITADELGAKTAIINAGLPLGGTCVNVGCVPSKTLLYAGEVLHHAKHHGVSGIELEVKNLDFQKVVQDELSMVEILRTEKYEKVLAHLKHVTLIEGKATFVSDHEVEVTHSTSSGQAGETLSAEKFVIATGSTANVPPIEGIHEVGFLTHIEALRLDSQPRELVVIGAGPVGLEYAQMYSRFGTKVTILQRGELLFPYSEPELVDRLVEALTKEGITIKTNVDVKSVRTENDKKVVSYNVNGVQEEVAVDEILLAAGKTANTQGLGLELVGVEVNERQAIVVSPQFQTSNPNIFAVGDVASLPLRLETTAGHEGTLVAGNALSAKGGSAFGGKGSMLFIDYNTVPYTIFADPQLAGVGITEAQQIKQTGACECRTVSFMDVPKAIIIRRTEGLIKMIIDPKTKQILGVHILAPSAGDLIAEAMMLVKNKNTIHDVIESLPMFPTLSEAIKIVALSFTKDISKLSCCV